MLMCLYHRPIFYAEKAESQAKNNSLASLEGAQPGDIVWAFDESENSDAVASGSLASVGEIVIDRVSERSELLSSAEKVAAPEEKIGENHLNSVKNPAVHIDAEKVDGILNLVGELVVIKSQIMQDETIVSLREQRLNGLLLLLDKTVRELQEASLSMRMTSLRGTFLRIQRTVMELSNRLSKPVDLELSGDETEIDRSIVELLSAPLMHLCRNALDHGIETPEERRVAGKSSNGCLRIVAGRQGGRIYIDVADDGRGIDKAKVVQAAKAKGFLAEDVDIKSLSERFIFDLLFQPGFSTSTEANDVSGRGVGLDVVKTNLEQAKGSIDVSSELGRGSTFRLRIPLTTAISDAMLLQACENTYVLPIEVIRELVQPEAGMISEGPDGEEVVNVRGTLLPLLRLADILKGVPNAASKARNSKSEVIIVVEESQIRVALMADAVLGQSQVVVKTLGPALPSSKGLAGAAILGDGRVGLIIDVLELIEGYRDE